VRAARWKPLSTGASAHSAAWYLMLWQTQLEGMIPPGNCYRTMAFDRCAACSRRATGTVEGCTRRTATTYPWIKHRYRRYQNSSSSGTGNPRNRRNVLCVEHHAFFSMRLAPSFNLLQAFNSLLAPSSDQSSECSILSQNSLRFFPSP
jgi:hypothetical protein